MPSASLTSEGGTDAFRRAIRLGADVSRSPRAARHVLDAFHRWPQDPHEEVGDLQERSRGTQVIEATEVEDAETLSPAHLDGERRCE